MKAAALIATVVLASYGGHVMSQTALDEIRMINEALQHQDPMVLMSEFAISSRVDSSLSQTGSSVIVKRGNSLYKKSGNLEIAASDSIQIVADHLNKHLIVSPYNPQLLSMEETTKKIHDVLGASNKVESFVENGIKGYKIWMGEDADGWLSFTYDEKRHHLKSFSVYFPTYPTGERIVEDVLLRSTFKYALDDGSVTVKEVTHFVNWVEDHYQPTPEYESYRFIDYLSITGKK